MANTKQSYKEKLLDPRWQKRRLEALEAGEWKCYWCGDTKSTLHVHHLYYETSGNPWDTDLDGLQVLCADCHFTDHLKLTELEKFLIDCVRHRDVIDQKGDPGNRFYFIRLLNRCVQREKGIEVAAELPKYSES